MNVAVLLFCLVGEWLAGGGASSFAADERHATEAELAQQAQAAWDQGMIGGALELLDRSLQHHPQALTLHRLRGDVLATSRHPSEALAAYETVLAANPSALDVRWAKWSVLIRSGQAEPALEELQRIAAADPRNPLIHLRLARELRKLDRLEDALDAYQRAVTLAPDLLSWRLALARARFDLLDYDGADRDIRTVLQRAPIGTPLELSAKNMLTVLYGSTERGRRFSPTMSPDATPEQLRAWSMIRADGYRLFEAGKYQEAEPIYRRLLALNPMDPLATQHLGLILINLGRCKEAVTVFKGGGDLDPTDEDYAITHFRMGECLVQLERWEEAYIQFKLLYDATVKFEEETKEMILPSGTRVMNKAVLTRRLNEIRPHIPDFIKELDAEEAAAAEAVKAAQAAIPQTEDEVMAKAARHLPPQNLLESGVPLMGRDADFTWFRYVIPAGKVIRDDSPTGAHDFIPLEPGISFTTVRKDIYLVFGLVTASYDEVPLAARCVKETADGYGAEPVAAQDRLIMSTNDQSGYFALPRPAGGWATGLYRCGLYAGEETSAYTQVDEVRFRIVDPPTVTSPS